MQCKKKDGTRVWQSKATTSVTSLQQQKHVEADTDGFRKVDSPPRMSPQKSNPVNTKNSFHILIVDEVNVGDVVCEIGVNDAGMEEHPPAPNE